MREKFLEGVALFNGGLYFEAHEIWEEAWNDAEGTPKRCLQALIQLAVALLKWQSDIPGGAIKMYRASLEKLSVLPDRCLGLELRSLENAFREFCEGLLKTPPAPYPTKAFSKLEVDQGQVLD